LELVADKTVLSVDEDGVRLDGKRPGAGDLVPWDEIERGRVSEALQPAFDKYLKELGPSLYRLRQRLKIGDYEGLLETAEKVYPRFSSRQSQTAYLVCQATMWGRLAHGQREAAVEPYLRCLELLRTGAAKEALLPGARRLATGPDLPYCLDLAPLWLDAAEAKLALPGVQEAIKKMAAPRPDEAYLYYVSLALAADDVPAAQRVLAAVQGTEPLMLELRDILLAQQELQQKVPGAALTALETRLPKLHPANRLLAHFWLAKWRAAGDATEANAAPQRDAVLDFLTVAALAEDRDPELAAAGLYHALQILDKLKDTAAATAVRRELLSRYRETAQGKLAAKQERP
ncbi:MAG: hypothetical protein IAF94_04625, partial [Pirellulaceae bacterium]|nr:hypothetical protein [Pirellulaceae bacterium]